MKKILLPVLLCFSLQLFAQKNMTNKSTVNALSKPKLVVGIVIDQMRWDYLTRFEPLYKSNGGFKRMMREGYNCNNTYVPYTPTVTACGHTCVYTGSVPNVHGITGNNWWDKQTRRNVYCSEDKSVEGVGNTKGDAGKMSPKNMLTTTIGDELRLATNFQSKVIGVAIKDRGAILPAGHNANAAYWYDSKTGSFITSSFYMKALPEWVNTFNNRKMVDSLYQLNWNTILDKSIYPQYATDDVKAYEGKPFGKEQLGFPYNLSQYVGKDYGKISYTPQGNTLTASMAKAAVINEHLGKGNATDFIAISFSSPDYIGHNFGPNSWEMVDDYVRLDDELGKLLDFFDTQIGKGNYTVFLTADHAVAHIPGFMKENKLPGGLFDDEGLMKEMNTKLKEKFGADSAIVSMHNYQVGIRDSIMANDKHISKKKIAAWVIHFLQQHEAVANVFELKNLMLEPMNAKAKDMLSNGYYPSRCGDIQIILKPGYIDGKATGTTHGLMYNYDAHIPLLWYGWGIQNGSSFNQVYMTDIAATVAALLKIQVPSGCIGKPILEVMKK